ncbi:hypothetical protein [Aquimarina intermedia]|uniref:Uncharacterized protein n=1 Tax=Aquimarina intermedia TaxID=350814 RepID=A0A5S5BZC7_9FLAO|nr:hypothetical protein [Aquimarina intermedia]TYP71420.1 hypothetical protein BD809_1091 [Aquimarina intermedia]
MKKILIVIISLQFLTSCKENKFQVESEFENGNSEIIFDQLTDTLIYGKNYSRKYKIKFDIQKDTLRKGMYINEMAIGKHFFYKKNMIICERNYVVPKPFFLDLDRANETIDFNTYKVRQDSTYLNTVIFFDKNGDSIIDKSHFYRAKFKKKKWNVNDSLEVDFEFYYPNYKVVKSELYFIVPSDTTMVTVAKADNDYTFKREILDKQHNEIEGVVDFAAYDKTKVKGDSTAYALRIMFINEKIEIE